METTARLAEFGAAGQPLQPSPIRSPLKATSRPGFAQTIFPQSHEAFDLLCIGAYSPDVVLPVISDGAYLNSALDELPVRPLPITPGVWMLRYEFVAIAFPLLSASIELTVENWNMVKAKEVEQTII
jgi:hypothetical protein